MINTYDPLFPWMELTVVSSIVFLRSILFYFPEGPSVLFFCIEIAGDWMNPTSKKEEFSSTMDHIYQRLGLLDDRLN